MFKKFIRPLYILVTILGIFLTTTKSVYALDVIVNIPEKYTEVIAGDRVYFDVEIKYPENPARKDLTLIYQVKQGNNIIAESKVLKAVETQASFIDYIVIPDNTTGSKYVVSVQIADNENLNQEVSASFNVVGKTNQFQIYFFSILGVIIVLGIIISWEINRLKNILKTDEK